MNFKFLDMNRKSLLSLLFTEDASSLGSSPLKTSEELKITHTLWYDKVSPAVIGQRRICS